MTFDRRVRSRTHDMTLTATDEAEQFLDDGLSLLEVKAAGAIPLWLTRFFSEERIYKVSFSKVGNAWQRELRRSLALRRLPRLDDVAAVPARRKTSRLALA